MELHLPGFLGRCEEQWTTFRRRGCIFRPDGTLITLWDWFLCATVCAQLSKNVGKHCIEMNCCASFFSLAFAHR